MNEKLCVFCNHLNFSTIGCYGDYPDPATLECMKGHFLQNPTKNSYGSSSRDVYDVADFRKAIIHAKDCPDYDEVKP